MPVPSRAAHPPAAATRASSASSATAFDLPRDIDVATEVCPKAFACENAACGRVHVGLRHCDHELNAADAHCPRHAERRCWYLHDDQERFVVRDLAQGSPLTLRRGFPLASNGKTAAGLGALPPSIFAAAAAAPPVPAEPPLPPAVVPPPPVAPSTASVWPRLASAPAAAAAPATQPPLQQAHVAAVALSAAAAVAAPVLAKLTVAPEFGGSSSGGGGGLPSLSAPPSAPWDLMVANLMGGGGGGLEAGGGLGLGALLSSGGTGGGSGVGAPPHAPPPPPLGLQGLGFGVGVPALPAAPPLPPFFASPPPAADAGGGLGLVLSPLVPDAAVSTPGRFGRRASPTAAPSVFFEGGGGDSALGALQQQQGLPPLMQAGQQGGLPRGRTGSLSGSALSGGSGPAAMTPGGGGGGAFGPDVVLLQATPPAHALHQAQLQQQPLLPPFGPSAVQQQLSPLFSSIDSPAQAFLRSNPAVFDWLRAQRAITRLGDLARDPLAITDEAIPFGGPARAAIIMDLARFGFIVEPPEEGGAAEGGKSPGGCGTAE